LNSSEIFTNLTSTEYALDAYDKVAPNSHLLVVVVFDGDFSQQQNENLNWALLLKKLEIR
jgi:hypothetical protein